MTTEMHSDKTSILNAVREQIIMKLPKKEALQCAEFSNQFFGTMSTDDLNLWTVADLYGASLNFWSLIYKKNSDSTKVKIYNPDFEHYGWQSTHTIVEVMTKDMPFLVESLRLVFHRMGIVLHLAIHMGGIRLERNNQGEVVNVLSKNNQDSATYQIEAPMMFLIDRQTDAHILALIESEIAAVLNDNRLVVQDWMKMREEVVTSIEEMKHLPSSFDQEHVHESIEFLKWLENHHFTFLGICDYVLEKQGHELWIRPVPGTGFGILQDGRPEAHPINLSALPLDAQELALSKQVIILAKAEIRSRVHRDTFIDYIGVKRFNDKGEVIGEKRIFGLFTSAAYYTYIRDIPLLRLKVAHVLQASKLDPRSHAGRIFINILETMPRDDLIQASEDELVSLTQGIFNLQDRKRIRLFARTDIYNRFISCLVYVPKERYNTSLRIDMEDILSEMLPANSISFNTQFSESILARIHFMIHLNQGAVRPTESLLKEIEKRLEQVCRTWSDDLQELLITNFGEEHGNTLSHRYLKAFSPSYTTHFDPRNALVDIKYLELLRQDQSLKMNIHRELDDNHGHYLLKLYHPNSTIPLSDVLPIIENMGLRAISERPFSLKLNNGELYWINEFTITYPNHDEIDLDNLRENFLEAFLQVWHKKAENDGFNKLVLDAGMDWRSVMMLRAYAKYTKQMGMTYSQDYIETALLHNVDIARMLGTYFHTRFSPQFIGDRALILTELRENLLQSLEQVSNLDEDRIIRQYIALIENTLRTNFYQLDAQGQFKSYVSFKFNSKDIPGMPKPHPMFEVFVYSPRFEAIHLRSSKVARGGLRWSDRKEDFRTEVLGLMKAQQVKNAVIVPNGSKGGFVPKLLDGLQSRDEVLAEAVSCYQLFIRGLLDITDNYVGADIIRPIAVVPYDDVDPYLVVAADKGTATFSDYANAISKEYGFWLGDAFASGGSNGYDHKKMGITARGAWESVKRHFYYLGKDIQTTGFTVLGIGDMAGDVFGNGMLLSKHIRLLAAFNHQHIFLDPNPDEGISYQERQRMFDLPRSSWEDYDVSCISEGGGVYSRSAKYIPISSQIAERFNIKETRLEPNELIRVLLTSSVELLWSAGIGTFVKSSQETNLEVGDRSNDAIRVDANMLNCSVIGEGGNLGVTQKGRIEYALNGGRMYTDFIDNSGGVSCSDKEVNIKILLEDLVKNGDLTLKQRDLLLSQMTDEVAGLVLKENDAQTRALSLWASQALRHVDLYIRYMDKLEQSGKLDRKIEFLPNTQTLLERKQNSQSLTIPEIAVIFCYSKILLKESLLASKILDSAYFHDVVVEYFPSPLRKKYTDQIQDHQLKREIIATKISNLVINEMGPSFIYRLSDETGAPAASIVSAYLVAREIINLDENLVILKGLENQVSASHMVEIQMLFVRLLRRLTRSLLRSNRRRIDIGQTIKKYKPALETFSTSLQKVLPERYQQYYEKRVLEYIEQGLPKNYAGSLVSFYGMFAVLDIADIALAKDIDIKVAASAYFAIGDFLELEFVRMQIIVFVVENHWDSLAREALRDDLDAQQRLLVESVLMKKDTPEMFKKRLDDWGSKHKALIKRWQTLLGQLKAANDLNFIMFFVAMRELLDLTQTAFQASES
ncbi:MAG: NAD-glutamate dehydrogenase [Gammaproteobacteria bacterium]|nr:NAD-glutamate dehydrogenase [Gammaproteobacteria bacterium]